MALRCECGTCNLCKARERMRQRRATDPERVRAVDRARYYRDPAKRIAANADQRRRNPGPSTTASRRWAEEHPEKRRAQVAVGNAIRDGRLIRQPCEICGATRVHAHHDDYGRPLDVRWFCPKHHKAAHR